MASRSAWMQLSCGELLAKTWAKVKIPLSKSSLLEAGMKKFASVTTESRVYNSVSGLEIGVEASAKSVDGLDKGCAVFSGSEGLSLPGSAAAPDSCNAVCAYAAEADVLCSLSAQMPLLAGLPLQAPHLHRTGWVPGQVFSNSRDDPDRTRDPWTAPSFLRQEDPVVRRNAVRVQELNIPGWSSFRFARVLRGVLREEECAALLANVNEKGFTPVLLNIGGDQQQLAPGVRDGHRTIVDSPEVTAWLMEVLRPYLPAELANGAQVVDLNERCRFLCYTPGQVFEGHYDGCYQRPLGHPHAGDCSRLTVQLYLNNVPESHGGGTTFFPNEPRSVKYQPEVGSVLIFSQDLFHEGSLLKTGLKYTVRTEVMYRPINHRSKYSVKKG